MPGFLSRQFVYAALASSVMITPFLAFAGGITLDGTRIVYPAGQKQVAVSVRNTSPKSSFMVQSWTEQSDGRKTADFIVTPPLYVSGPGNENTLRLMYVGAPVKADRETLYYFNTKAIPAMDKKDGENKNLLMLAAITRIKLFVRPEGLTPSVDKAPAALNFRRDGKSLEVVNPTPYYITLAQINIGGHKLPDTMVAPRGSIRMPLPATTDNTISYRNINDYGAVTPVMHAVVR
ncbi:TPA: fimbria/pilus periplasmic chaperone [Klebsiella oxytoca]|nr:fimbria/pilus periplasmic chaperone [Klebsiella oxytoca]